MILIRITDSFFLPSIHLVWKQNVYRNIIIVLFLCNKQTVYRNIMSDP
jgi:hypothetical protein